MIPMRTYSCTRSALATAETCAAVSATVVPKDIAGVVLMPLRASSYSLIAVPALCCTIPHVICLRSEEQVVRVAARRRVAAVEHVKPIRYWTVDAFPRKTVSRNSTTPAHSESSVSTATAADPQVAASRRLRHPHLIESRPVAFFHNTILPRSEAR